MRNKFLACFLVLLFAFGFAGCKQEERVNRINDILESEYVNVYGRYDYDETNKNVIFPNIASGIEVRFYGTELHAEMAKGIAIKTAQGYNTLFSVLIDGSIDTDAHSVVLRSQFMDNVVLADGLEEDWHTVRIMKKDASNKTLMLIKSVSTDGYFGTPPEKPSVRVMVYGDSITEGALMKSDVSMSLDVRNDGLSTYIMKPVLELGYDADIFARDGAVLACEWASEPGKSTVKNYNKICYDLANKEWDMTKFIPDVIVIYLGTNDRSAGGTLQQFEDGYVELIEKLVNLYGQQVKFILCCGAMNDFSLDGVMARIADKAQNVQVLEFPRCKGGANSIGHPLLAEHEAYAEQMKAALLSAVGE